jgi:ribosomal protein S18 acetylase RimI-like enzyme
MITAGHQHSVTVGQPKSTAYGTPDRSCAENDVARHVSHRNLGQWWAMELTLSFRDLEPADLSDLDWSGGPEHIRAVAEALEASYAGEVALLVGYLPNDRLIAMGAVDFRPSEDAGSIWMLAVHELFQSLGAGAQLIAALERKIIDQGRPLARMLVEHDNPRARVLYERLGYSDAGATLDSWPVAGGRTYVTACTIMERRLAEVQGDGAPAD